MGAARIAACVLAAAVVLGGCGSSEPEPGSGNASANAPRIARPAGGRPDMVAAVSPADTPHDVELRFALAGRPVVGQPLDIEIALTPNAELERVFARFQASEGLKLVKGMETRDFQHPAPGKPLSHTLTVIPQADGIFSISASVVIDSLTRSITRSYSIPIIAGEGLPEPPPTATAPAAPPTAALPGHP
jgi:hypothetical protein